MAVSDGALFILISQIGVYVTLFNSKVRLTRMIGAFTMIVVGLTAIMVEDTIITFLFFGISSILALSKLFPDIVKTFWG